MCDDLLMGPCSVDRCTPGSHFSNIKGEELDGQLLIQALKIKGFHWEDGSPRVS